MTEQHDVDQSYELPEEIITGKSDDRRHAVNVSGGDGDADQRHHAGIAGANFLPQPVEKRPAAVKIDDTGQSGENVSVACKAPPLAHAEHVLDHRGEGKNRDCQEQADPEALSEIRHHLAVVVPGMAAVTGMRAMIVVFAHGFRWLDSTFAVAEFSRTLSLAVFCYVRLCSRSLSFQKSHAIP